MLRLIGILIGSALAVGFLIVALGVPKIAGPDPVAASQPAPEPPPEPAPETAAVDLPAPQPAPVDGDPPATEPAPEAKPDADTLALIDRIFEPGPESGAIDEEDTFVADNWYAFWSPFRSEIAANGFVARLQETTGIDYRVVKVKTGVYEVAFAYTDDADIQDKLARISSATGLDMSGS